MNLFRGTQIYALKSFHWRDTNEMSSSPFTTMCYHEVALDISDINGVPFEIPWVSATLHFSIPKNMKKSQIAMV